MKSTRKGNDLEKIAKQYLEDEGNYVHRAIRSYIKLPSGKTIVRSNDIFKCFDLVAISLLLPPRFIQITTKAGVYTRKAKIDAKFRPGNYGVTFEVWGWHGGRGRRYFAVYVRTEKGWIREELKVNV